MAKAGIIGLALLTLMACTKKQELSGADSPERALTNYVQTFFTMEKLADREKLNAYLSGEASKRIGEWSEAEFELQITQNKKKFSSLKVFDQKFFRDDQANLTYEIEYVETGTGAKVVQKKIALMKKEGEQWKIRDARNLSQLIEFPETETTP